MDLAHRDVDEVRQGVMLSHARGGQLLVTIIIPVYNCADHLEQCLESILGQTHTTLNVIAVDDGSTDDSGRICDSYASRDARVTVLHCVNGGASSARNAGLEQAEGELVLFCDGDDWVEQDWVSSLVAAVGATEFCLAVCGYEIFDARSKRQVRPAATRASLFSQSLSRHLFFLPASEFLVLEQDRLLNSNCNKVYRRGLIDKNRLRFDPSIRSGQDLVFNLDYLRSTDTFPNDIAVVDRCLYHYRKWSSTSLSSSFTPHKWDTAVSVRELVRSTVEGFGGAWDRHRDQYFATYFNILENCLENTLSTQNPDTFAGKVRSLRQILRSRTAREIVANSTLSHRDPLRVLALRRASPLLWLIDRTIHRARRVRQR